MITVTCGHRDLSARGRGVLVREVGVMGEGRAEEVRVAAAWRLGLGGGEGGGDGGGGLGGGGE
eukprot:2513919-Prymnesium_polylepis.1